MDNMKNNNYYINKVKHDLEFIVIHMKNIDIEELDADEVLLLLKFWIKIQEVRYEWYRVKALWHSG